METVVVGTSNNVISKDTELEFVSNTASDNTLVETPNGNIITVSTCETVLLETDSTNLVITGIMGPSGADGRSEEEMVYSKRIDFVTDNEIYRGEAVAGTLDTSPGWRIRKVLISSDGDVSETWATGNTDFNKVWTNRLSYIYS